MAETRGGPPPNYTDDDRCLCPKCGTDFEDDEYIPGYGLAYGGGLGTYWYCTNDNCDWFYKQLDAGDE